MKKKNPLKLTWLLIPYNLSMALLNGYIAVELFIASTRLKYSYVCQPVTYINHKEELRVSIVCSFKVVFRESFSFFIEKLNFSDSKRCVVVLLLKIARILRHFFFYSKEKGKTAYFPTRLSPLYNVFALVDRN